MLIYRVFQENLYKVCQVINFETFVLGLRRLYQNAQLTVFIGKVSLIVSLETADLNTAIVLKTHVPELLLLLTSLSVCLYLCVFLCCLFITLLSELCH